MYPEVIKNIPDLIKESRKKSGLTQTSLANMAKVTKQAISQIELGLSIPDESTIKGLSRVLNIDYNRLLYSCHPKIWIENHVQSYIKGNRKVLKKYDDLVADVLREFLSVNCNEF